MNRSTAASRGKIQPANLQLQTAEKERDGRNPVYNNGLVADFLAGCGKTRHWTGRGCFRTRTRQVGRVPGPPCTRNPCKQILTRISSNTCIPDFEILRHYTRRHTRKRTSRTLLTGRCQGLDHLANQAGDFAPANGIRRGSLFSPIIFQTDTAPLHAIAERDARLRSCSSNSFLRIRMDFGVTSTSSSSSMNSSACSSERV